MRKQNLENVFPGLISRMDVTGFGESKAEWLSQYKESFTSPGVYPDSNLKGLLNQYTMKPSPQLSTMNYGDQYHLYTISPPSSYKQETNNKKNWSSPCNGTMAPASFCNSLYDKKIVDPQIPYCMPALDCNNEKRVNFYCATSSLA